jgi:hypothetical protein
LVIIAIIIVIGIALSSFILKKPSVKIIPDENPRAFIEQCIGEVLEKNEKIIIDSNFYPNRTSNFILYQGKVVPYLCKSSQFYYPCVNQEPLIIKRTSKLLGNMSSVGVEKCFKELINNLKEKDYEVQEGNLDIDIELSEGIISANIQKRINTQKGRETKNYETFSSVILSPLYRLLDTSRNIINYESFLCEFDTVNWEMHYRDIQFDKFITSEGTKIYTLTDKKSQKAINFAVKTCVLPAGL